MSQLIDRAKIAEQAERYEDMAKVSVGDLRVDHGWLPFMLNS